MRILCAVFLCAVQALLGETVRLDDEKGDVWFSPSPLHFSPIGIASGWRVLRPQASVDGHWRIASSAGNGTSFVGRTELKPCQEGLALTMTVEDGSDSADCQFALQWELPASDHVGGLIAFADGFTLVLPKIAEKGPLANRTVTGFSLKTPGATNMLSFAFGVPVDVAVQDDRFWGNADFLIRVKRNVQLTLAAEGGLTLKRGAVVTTAGPDWIPLVSSFMPEKGSALDFSGFAGPRERAGRYGYPVVRDGHFEFENLPGVRQRFYGVNTAFACNVLSRENSKAFARTLAMSGYNAVRIHHHESFLFDSTTCAFLPEAIDKFDYLVAALIEEGIYLTSDLFVSRNVPYRSIGIDKNGTVPAQVYKELVLFLPSARQDYLRFVEQFLLHRNPYTGRCYAEEPALGWLSLINEGNVGNFGLNTLHNYSDSVVPRWREWLSEKRKLEPAKYGDIPETIPDGRLERQETPHKYAFARFIADVETSFGRQVRAFLRDELKCRALTANMNSSLYPIPYEIPRGMVHDYVDDHFYVDHPQFLEDYWKLPSYSANRNPFKENERGVPKPVWRRIVGKPFTVTEWNAAAPGAFRGVSGLVAGSLAGLQDWDGVWRYVWSHSAEGAVTPQTLGYFELAGDPLGRAAERAALCLFLRGDMPPAETFAAYGITTSRVAEASAAPDLDWTAVAAKAWRTRVGLSVESGGAACRAGVFPGPIRSCFPVADTLVRIDPEAGTFRVVTARTAGGYASEGTFRAGALRATMKNAATIWISSLDGAPIEKSGRLLVTHLTDSRNTGEKFADDAGRVLLDWGCLPQLMRRGAADLSIQLNEAYYRVYALSESGRRRFEIPATYSSGVLSFTVDVGLVSGEATYLYEVQREEKCYNVRHGESLD